MEIAKCYVDRDNSFCVYFKRNGVLLTEVEMAAITKFEIKHNGTYYNSDDYPSAFTAYNASGYVKIKPYVLGLDVSVDDVEIILYDAGDHPHGLMWSTFQLIMDGSVQTTTAPPTTVAPTTVP